MKLVDHIAYAQHLAADGEVHRGLDVAMGALDDALGDGEFAEVDSTLRALDFEKLDVDLAVALLMTAKPARDRLPSRAAAVSRFATHVRATLPEHSERILRWL
jgi:hypothetical protein